MREEIVVFANEIVLGDWICWKPGVWNMVHKIEYAPPSNMSVPSVYPNKIRAHCFYGYKEIPTGMRVTIKREVRQ